MRESAGSLCACLCTLKRHRKAEMEIENVGVCVCNWRFRSFISWRGGKQERMELSNYFLFLQKVPPCVFICPSEAQIDKRERDTRLTIWIKTILYRTLQKSR